MFCFTHGCFNAESCIGCFHVQYDVRMEEMLNISQRKRKGRENNFQIIRPKKEIGRKSLKFKGTVILEGCSWRYKDYKEEKLLCCKARKKSTKHNISRTTGPLRNSRIFPAIFVILLDFRYWDHSVRHYLNRNPPWFDSMLYFSVTVETICWWKFCKV